GADSNILNLDINTPLHTASLKGYVHIIKMLLENEADPNIPDKREYTALHLVINAEMNHQTRDDIVQMLIEHGADANRNNESQISPLHIASHEGHARIVKILLGNNADPNKTDKYGDCALHRVMINAEMDHQTRDDIVHLLIEH
ncbi:hypothetical protein CAPTEDRAFT_46842, partial [Capitella teleta]